MVKKIKAPLRRAFHYFGFDHVDSYPEVQKHIAVLKDAADGNEDLLAKIDEHVNTIEKFFNTDELKEDTEFFAEFQNEEPRKSWNHFTEHFDNDILENIKEIVSEDDLEDVPVSEEIEPVEEVESVEDDLEDVSVSEEIEPVEDDLEDVSVSEEIEPVEDDLEDVSVSEEIEPVEEDEPVIEEVIPEPEQS